MLLELNGKKNEARMRGEGGQGFGREEFLLLFGLIRLVSFFFFVNGGRGIERSFCLVFC